MDGGLLDTNLGKGICAVLGAGMISRPVSDWLVTPVPSISCSRWLRCAGVGDHEIGSGELGSRRATGGGMETPLWLEVVIHAGKFLPIRPLVTVADPGKISPPPGGVCRRLIPLKGTPLVGGPAKPLAQQGLCRMQSLQVRLKQKLHSSVMDDPLHLSHTRLSGAES